MPIFLYFEGNFRVYLHIYSIQKHAGGYMASFLGRPYMNISSFTSVCPSVCVIFCTPTPLLIYKEKGKVFSLFLFPGEGRNHPCSKYFLVSPGNVMAASSLRQLNGVNCRTHAIYNHSFLVTALRQKQLVGAKNISSIITSLD